MIKIKEYKNGNVRIDFPLEENREMSIFVDKKGVHYTETNHEDGAWWLRSDIYWEYGSKTSNEVYFNGVKSK